MPSNQQPWRFSDARLWVALGFVCLFATIAWSRQPATAPIADGVRNRMEYLHQEVLSDAVVQTLNDLDGQGWEIFQIIPSWQFKNENAENALVPRAYQVFGKRPLKDGK
jgi:hypothetical protein